VFTGSPHDVLPVRKRWHLRKVFLSWFSTLLCRLLPREERKKSTTKGTIDTVVHSDGGILCSDSADAVGVASLVDGDGGNQNAVEAPALLSRPEPTNANNDDAAVEAVSHHDKNTIDHPASVDRPGATSADSDGAGDGAGLVDTPGESAGLQDNLTVNNLVKSIYDKIVHWRKNLFSVPSGGVGKAFVRELTKQIQLYTNSQGKDGMALYKLFILPALLLQRVNGSCRAKECVKHLERRLSLWQADSYSELLDEGLTLQKNFKTNRRPRLQGGDDDARAFGNLMAKGRIHGAIRALSSDGEVGDGKPVLRSDDVVTINDTSRSVRDILQEKHPLPQVASFDALLTSEPNKENPIRFAAITGSSIKKAAIHVNGSAGPSGLDADGWRRICTVFKGASTELCEAMALFTRLLCTQPVSGETLAPYIACRLIALNKNPGVRPIGVCEVLRRICTRSALQIMRTDIVQVCGPWQSCAGIPAGIEATQHAMGSIFEGDDTEGMLLIDASNAFNSLNREVALHNIPRICPCLADITNNTYNAPARLFIAGGGEILSQEGTTQGDPLAMCMYAVAMMPLVNKVAELVPGSRQGWFADDSAAAGKLCVLRKWYDAVKCNGTGYGYSINEGKSQLLVKEQFSELALELFRDTNIKIETSGVVYLGAAMGNPGFKRSFLETKIGEWIGELRVLAKFARTEPQAAYATLTHGLRGKWQYIFRTMVIDGDLLSAMGDVITNELLPSIAGQVSISESDLSLLFLPVRDGGLGIPNVKSMHTRQRQSSLYVTKPMVNALMNPTKPNEWTANEQTEETGDIIISCHDVGDLPSPQNDPVVHENTPQASAEATRPGLLIDPLLHSAHASADIALIDPFTGVCHEVGQRRRKTRKKNREIDKENKANVVASCSDSEKRRLVELTADGASSWLSVLPLAEYSFRLNKGEFWDALAIRYKWQLKGTPLTCICGVDFSVDHAMHCKRGGPSKHRTPIATSHWGSFQSANH